MAVAYPGITTLVIEIQGHYICFIYETLTSCRCLQNDYDQLLFGFEILTKCIKHSYQIYD